MSSNRLIIFSMNRSGSMLLFQVCHVLAKELGLKYISANRGDVQVPMRSFAEEPEKWLSQPNTGVGPIRIYVPVPKIEEARILLHLRDPRDVLVSMFYSYCYSHPGEVPSGQGYRAKVAERGIDDFVIRMSESDTNPLQGDYGTHADLWDIAGNLRQRYIDYTEKLLGRPNLVTARYEDMVLNPARWLASVGEAFECKNAKLLERVETNILGKPVPEENPMSHKRQVIPSDYKRKLKESTIERLNSIYKPVLDSLGYVE